MEKALRRLVDANAEIRRKEWALAWQKAGGKVIGVVTPLVPVEIISAAGALPWRLTGSWKGHATLASAHRSSFTNPYNCSVLESMLEDEFSFLDGCVIADSDIDTRRLWDVWSAHRGAPPAFLLYVPRQPHLAGRTMLAGQMRKMAEFVSTIAGPAIGADSLFSAIQVHNRVRGLIAGLYGLRKRSQPPLSGSEFLGITLASMVMPPRAFIDSIEAILPYLQTRRTSLQKVRPRVLLSSDCLDDPALIALIEDVGSLVAMDDLDTGNAYCSGLVDTTSADPFAALARWYLDNCTAPRMLTWDDQVRRVLDSVKEFDIDGVIEMPLTFSHPRALRAFYFQDAIRKAGVPYIGITRDYQLSNVGQIRTKVQAFVEMLVKD